MWVGLQKTSLNNYCLKQRAKTEREERKTRKKEKKKKNTNNTNFLLKS